MNRLFLLIVVVSLAVIGCSNDSSSQGGAHHIHVEDPSPQASENQDSEKPEEETKYTLHAVVNDQYELLIETNLQFSKENYNRSHQEGEGHVHLYVNNRLIGPLQDKGPVFMSNYLKDGDNTVKLVLASNNHDESKYQTSYEFTVNYEEGSAP